MARVTQLTQKGEPGSRGQLSYEQIRCHISGGHGATVVKGRRGLAGPGEVDFAARV